MNKLKYIFAALIIAVVAYVAASPYITVSQMRTAAETGDSGALSEYIDFASVRQSLKAQMNVMLAEKMAEDEEMQGNPFAALGAGLASAMVDKIVDVYVTPAGIRQLMAGKKPKPGSDNDNSISDSSNAAFEDASMAYASYDKFIITVKNAQGEEAEFILRRQGLAGWVLTDIIIPQDL